MALFPIDCVTCAAPKEADLCNLFLPSRVSLGSEGDSRREIGREVDEGEALDVGNRESKEKGRGRVRGRGARSKVQRGGDGGDREMRKKTLKISEVKAICSLAINVPY